MVSFIPRCYPISGVTTALMHELLALLAFFLHIPQLREQRIQLIPQLKDEFIHRLIDGAIDGCIAGFCCCPANAMGTGLVLIPVSEQQLIAVVFRQLVAEVNTHGGMVAGFFAAALFFVDLAAQGALLQFLADVEVIDAPTAVSVPGP